MIQNLAASCRTWTGTIYCELQQTNCNEGFNTFSIKYNFDESKCCSCCFCWKVCIEIHALMFTLECKLNIVWTNKNVFITAKIKFHFSFSIIHLKTYLKNLKDLYKLHKRSWCFNKLLIKTYWFLRKLSYMVYKFNYLRFHFLIGKHPT